MKVDDNMNKTYISVEEVENTKSRLDIIMNGYRVFQDIINLFKSGDDTAKNYLNKGYAYCSHRNVNLPEEYYYAIKYMLIDLYEYERDFRNKNMSDLVQQLMNENEALRKENSDLKSKINYFVQHTCEQIQTLSRENSRLRTICNMDNQQVIIHKSWISEPKE